MTIDVLYLAWNRLEFTRASLAALRANTEWDLVRRLIIHDDGSTDGTREMLEDELEDWPVPVELRLETNSGSPVDVMRRYLHGPHATPATIFAKIDSDVAVPPGWLGHMNDVMERNPGVELLGMEAGMTRVVGRGEGYGDLPWDGVYGWQLSSHIGGVGLMRTSTFDARRPLRPDGRFGFTEWQHIHRPARGWITPDLPVVLLDRLPFEPWLSLSDTYEELEWQRYWPKWDPVWMAWAWEWFTNEKEVAA